MSSHPLKASGALRLAARFALRELRGGVRGFGVFLGCLTLGVAAIAAVGSVSHSLTDGLAAQGTTLLGGDASFTLVQREAAPAELAALEGGGQLSASASLRAMAGAGAESTLAEVKAVSDNYPLVGAMELDPPTPIAAALAERDGRFGAVADPLLAERLGLKVGDPLTLGALTLQLSALIVREPDSLSTGIGFGPRLMVSQAALRASGLLQPGSLVRWTYRVKLDAPARLPEFLETVQKVAPEAGFEVRTRNAASPRLETNVRRFTDYLTMVGLTALLVGGVGVANAVSNHLESKRATIATLKTLGASGRMVFAVYLTEIGLIAGVGIAAGLAIGAAIPFIIQAIFGGALALPLEASLQPAALLLALAYGALIALAFALWPLGLAHDLPVTTLFRDRVEPGRVRPRLLYIALTGLAGAALCALALSAAEERRTAIAYLVAAVAVLAVLRLIASGVMALARRLPRPRATVARLALANIHRPGALTPTVVLSLGLGLTLLVTLALIDRSLTRALTADLPEQAPSFFFLDVQSTETTQFSDFLTSRAPAGKVEVVPMLRGRLTAMGGRPVETITPPPDLAWVLSSDRGITYSETVPEGSTLAEGQWWPADYAGPPLMSLEKEIADGFGLKIGDPVTVNVLGRNITATIANLRNVEWERLAINFVMVFPPATFRSAPHTALATLAFPEGTVSEAQERALARDIAHAFPAVTIVRVKEALAQIGSLVGSLVMAVRGASLVTLLASILVLAGALAAGQHHRVYDAVILKTLGATRARLVAAFALEYAALGLATAAVAVAAGTLAAYLVVTRIMEIGFAWSAGAALGAVAAALALTVGFGLVGTWRALGRKPASVLLDR
ncbi:MAG TPA: FtsX-like permease family protein [Xanthobacteraceae bacterium]|nr:FtsX-like permease family protein [Xanthobacteraceae bacterium]